MTSYPIVIVELPEAEGGGFLGAARAAGRPVPPAGTDRLRAAIDSEDAWTRLHPRRSAAG